MSPNLEDIKNRNLKPYLTKFLALIKESKEILGNWNINRIYRELFSKLEEHAKQGAYPEDNLLDDLAIALIDNAYPPKRDKDYTAAYVARYIILDWVEESKTKEIVALIDHDYFDIDNSNKEVTIALSSKVNLRYIED